MFDHIIGQEIPKKLLKNSLQNNRLPSSLLFYGPEGVGKRTMAFALSKILNCKNTDIQHSEFRYCEVCPSCKKINHRNHPDVRIIEPESKGKREIPINAIRELRREVMLTLYEGKKRIFLLLKADRMTTEASNAFLKTLEEPPPDTLFILTSTRPGFLLSTILSRCQKIRFSRLNPKDIEKELIERLGLREEKAKLLSRISNGTLGGVLNHENEEYLKFRESFSNFFFQIPEKSHLDVLDYVEEVDPHQILQFLFSFYRDLLLLKGENGEGFLENVDLLSSLRNLEKQLSLDEVISRIQELEIGWNSFYHFVNPQLILSTFLFRHLKSDETI